ncbi:hypothetical protein MMC13_007083 [Lambiella insularis]|nr:hypothetical protein [Lambiella insularis]
MVDTLDRSAVNDCAKRYGEILEKYNTKPYWPSAEIFAFEKWKDVYYEKIKAATSEYQEQTRWYELMLKPVEEVLERGKKRRALARKDRAEKYVRTVDDLEEHMRKVEDIVARVAEAKSKESSG